MVGDGVADAVMVGMDVAVFVEVGVAGGMAGAHAVRIKIRMVTIFFISSSSNITRPIYHCSMGGIPLKVKNVLNVIRFLV